MLSLLAVRDSYSYSYSYSYSKGLRVRVGVGVRVGAPNTEPLIIRERTEEGHIERLPGHASGDGRDEGAHDQKRQSGDEREAVDGRFDLHRLIVRHFSEQLLHTAGALAGRHHA